MKIQTQYEATTIRLAQGKRVVWLDLGTFDYGKRTDIFNHLEYRTYSGLNKNRHYANDNGLYL